MLIDEADVFMGKRTDSTQTSKEALVAGKFILQFNMLFLNSCSIFTRFRILLRRHFSDHKSHSSF